MSKPDVGKQIFYSKTMENYLSIIIRNHGYQDMLEEIKWENVKNVEQLFHRLGRSGQWPDAHPKLEKELS